MKEAVGGTWLFNIVIFFVILFTGYLCLSINHTKAFNVKDDIVKIIERDGGFDNLNNVNATNNNTIKGIVKSLQEFGYRSTGACPAANGGQVWFGFDRDGKRDGSNNNSAFCIREVNANPTRVGGPDAVYYQVVVFYQLDLPIFKSLFGFKAKGDTMLIYKS